ncbi:MULTISPECIES: tyrosine-type recombinase/integrase [unclassified Brevibacterium]|uniref:tyrosine-type recombinase/integrase n=1 Tax=unclassified Brevibacterium TaxID=2614124 RepID=UPI0018677152|nr:MULTISPECIES: site-specific integrase [unclassified Brevibacterium]
MTARAVFGAIDRLPSGRFRVRYTAPDGTRHKVPGTFGTRQEAEAVRVRVHAEVLGNNPVIAKPSAITVGQYLSDYLDHARATLRPRTLDLYRRTADSWILCPVGTTTPVDISTVTVQALTPGFVRTWYVALLDGTRAAALDQSATSRRGPHPARAWAMSHGFDVAPTGKLPTDVLDAWTAAGSPAPPVPTTAGEYPGRTAAAGAYRLLRTVLMQAVRDGLITANPVHVKGAGTAPHPERRPLTATEVVALADAMPDRYRAAVLIAAWSGLRPGEAFALRRGDLDLHAATVTVTRTLVEVPGEPVVYGPPKSAAGRRNVNLPRSILPVLADHLHQHTGIDPDALMFTTGHGNPVTASTRSGVMRRARLAIDRPDIAWHHLRHTGATLAAQAGATQAELQARIGHSTARAAAIYQHAGNDRDRALADRLDQLTSTSSPTPTDPTPTGPSTPAADPEPSTSETTGAYTDTARAQNRRASAALAFGTRRGHLAAIS